MDRDSCNWICDRITHVCALCMHAPMMKPEASRVMHIMMPLRAMHRMLSMSMDMQCRM